MIAILSTVGMDSAEVAGGVVAWAETVEHVVDVVFAVYCHSLKTQDALRNIVEDFSASTWNTSENASTRQKIIQHTAESSYTVCARVTNVRQFPINI